MVPSEGSAKLLIRNVRSEKKLDQQVFSELLNISFIWHPAMFEEKKKCVNAKQRSAMLIQG